MARVMFMMANMARMGMMFATTALVMKIMNLDDYEKAYDYE